MKMLSSELFIFSTDDHLVIDDFFFFFFSFVPRSMGGAALVGVTEVMRVLRSDEEAPKW